MSQPTVEDLRKRVRRIMEQSPAALLSWQDLIRDAESLASASSDTASGVRFGELEYVHGVLTDCRIRVPATLSVAHPRPLVVEMTPNTRASAMSLLNSIALRFALCMPRQRTRVVVIDPFDGSSVSDSLRDLRLSKSKLLTFRPPNTVVNWLTEHTDMATLVVVYHSLLEREAEEIQECRFGFKPAELTRLIQYLGAPECRTLSVIAWESDVPLHPLRMAMDDGSLRPTRIELKNGAIELGSANLLPELSPLFTPDSAPATDIAMDLLTKAGLN